MNNDLKAILLGEQEQAIRPPDDEVTREVCPFLWEFLVESNLGGKQRRVLSDIKITRVDRFYQVTLQDHQSRLQASTICTRLDAIGSALEEMLKDSKTVWHPFNSYKVKPKKKVSGEEGA